FVIPLLATYDIQIDTVATECCSHFIHEKDVDEVEREPGEHGTRVTQHLELRIGEVFRRRGLNPCCFRLAVLHQHETSQQPPLIEEHAPNPARKICERHCCDAAVIDPCADFFPKPHREHLQQPALNLAIERRMRSHAVYGENVIRCQRIPVAVDWNSIRQVPHHFGIHG